MDVKILVTLFGALVATAYCQTSSEPPTTESTAFVQGVFIPADALKSLQEKAKQPDAAAPESQTEPPKVSKHSDQISPDQPENQGYQNQQMQDPQMNQQIGNQQNYPPQQIYSNQPMLNGNQQYPLNPQMGYNQYGYQQPGYQQPGFQNNLGPQTFAPSQQAILLTQQPGYQNQQGMLNNQQPYQQSMLVAQPPNQQLFFPNGQIVQPNMVANPNVMGNPVQGQNNLYTMVPVNGQNPMQNPNLGNNNGYFVPVQQLPSNPILLNNGK